MIKNEGRRPTSVALTSFTFADFVSGVGKLVVDLPSGSIVTGGFLVIDEVFDSVTSDTLTVGDAGVAARYKGGIDGQALAATALVPTMAEVLSDTGSILIGWTGVGTAPTTGAGRILVEYIETARADFVQR
jgi:hypothetical protein